MAELEHAGMRLPFSDLCCATTAATHVAHIFQANFELHSYDVEK
jgi:hypothetical protein